MCVIEFTERKIGHTAVIVNAGEEIEITANGLQVLKAEVPEGRVWKATISVQVIESDV